MDALILLLFLQPAVQQPGATQCSPYIVLCQVAFIGRNTFAARRANTLVGQTMHLRFVNVITNTAHFHCTLVRMQAVRDR